MTVYDRLYATQTASSRAKRRGMDAAPENSNISSGKGQKKTNTSRASSKPKPPPLGTSTNKAAAATNTTKVDHIPGLDDDGDEDHS